MNGSCDHGAWGGSAQVLGALGEVADTTLHQNTTKARLERSRAQYLSQVEYYQSRVAKIDKALDVLKDNPELDAIFDSLLNAFTARGTGIY